jgi:hypothetical protein
MRPHNAKLRRHRWKTARLRDRLTRIAPAFRKAAVILQLGRNFLKKQDKLMIGS